jgi:hypothetical protein
LNIAGASSSASAFFVPVVANNSADDANNNNNSVDDDGIEPDEYHPEMADDSDGEDEALDELNSKLQVQELLGCLN